MPTVPQLVNPSLEWDNQTPILHGVPVEQPTGWQVAQPDASHKDNTLGMFHRPGGFGIDAGDKTGTLVLYQTGIHFPAGTYALRIDLLSHVRREGPWDAKWEVAVITPGGKARSIEMWVTNRKGSTPLIGIISNTQAVTGSLELRYTVRYASTHGEMQIRRVRFTDTLPPTPNFRLTLQHTPADINALQPVIADLRTHVGLARAIQRRLVDNAAVQNDLNQQLLDAMQKQEAATERLYQLIKNH